MSYLRTLVLPALAPCPLRLQPAFPLYPPLRASGLCAEALEAGKLGDYFQSNTASHAVYYTVCTTPLPCSPLLASDYAVPLLESRKN